MGLKKKLQQLIKNEESSRTGGHFRIDFLLFGIALVIVIGIKVVG
jgi:hypothetical protein